MERRRSLALALLLAAAAPFSVGAAATRTVNLEILGTTDLHGHIYPTTYYGDKKDQPLGLAKVATLIERERAAHKNVVLVDSGDILQGSPLTTWFFRHGDPMHHVDPMIAAMNALHYDAATWGNHDFDYGLPLVYKAANDAKFPFVSSNIYWHGTEIPAFKPYVILDVGGIKVGIIGGTPPGVGLWDRAQVHGKLDFGDEVAAFYRWAPRVRALGADVIVGIPHAGYGGDGPFGPTYDGYAADSGLPGEQVGYTLAREIRDLDVLMLGHSHHLVWSDPSTYSTMVYGLMAGKTVQDPLGRPLAIVQADKWGSHLAVVRLELQRESGRWAIVKRQTENLSTQGVPADPHILALARSAHLATLAYVNKAIATTPSTWSGRLSRVEDTPLVDLINAVQLAQTHAQLSAAADFDPTVSLARGPISMAEVAGLYPYQNLLVAVRITGKQLKDYLEWTARYYADYKPGGKVIGTSVPGFDYDMIAGVDYTIDTRRSVGSRITHLTYHGRPVRDDQTFTLALNSYRQRGGGGFGAFNTDPVVYNRGEDIEELIVRYLRDKKRIAPAQVFQHDNWRLVPAIDPTTLRYR